MNTVAPAQIGRSPYDDAIIAGFSNRMSAEEVSASKPILGALSPAQCLLRLQQLIASKDILDAKDTLALLLEDIYFLRGKLRKQMDEQDYVDKDLATTWLKTIDAAATRVDKANIGLNDAMMRFTEVRAREFVEALGFIFGRFIDAAQERVPEVGEYSDELRTIVLDAIPESLPEVQR